MKGDRDRRRARAPAAPAAGLTWGELDAATQAHGLAVTGGRMSTTGVGGLALGGGSGWIERKCGYTVDNLLAVELVTADGRIVTRLRDRARGPVLGAPAAAAATSASRRASTSACTRSGRPSWAGCSLYPAPMAAAVLRNFRDVMADAPDEVGAGVALLTAPHDDFVPEPLRGQPVVGVIVCYAGPVEDGEAALRPLREFGPPALDMVEPMPYVGRAAADRRRLPAGLRNYWTGDFLTGLPDEAIEVLCRFHASEAVAAGRRCSCSRAAARPRGCRTARWRSASAAAPFNLHITSLWDDPADDEANIAWTRELQRGDEAVHHRPRVRELHRRRGRRTRRRVVRRARATRGCRRSRTATTRATCSASDQNIKPSA